jgi:uncharacterized membrane protein
VLGVFFWLYLQSYVAILISIVWSICCVFLLRYILPGSTKMLGNVVSESTSTLFMAFLPLIVIPVISKWHLQRRTDYYHKKSFTTTVY